MPAKPAAMAGVACCIGAAIQLHASMVGSRRSYKSYKSYKSGPAGYPALIGRVKCAGGLPVAALLPKAGRWNLPVDMLVLLSKHTAAGAATAVYQE